MVVEAFRFLSRRGSPAQANALLDCACDEFLFGRLLIDQFERGVGGLLRDLLRFEVAREPLTTDGLLPDAVRRETKCEALVVEIAVLFELRQSVSDRRLVRPLLLQETLAQLLDRARLRREQLHGPLQRPLARLLRVGRARAARLLFAPALLFELLSSPSHRLKIL